MKNEKYKFLLHDIFKTIGKVVLKGLITGAIMEVAGRFGVPISASYDYEPGKLPHPDNATEQAIKGIHDCAVDASFDHDKIKAANRIVNVITNACPDDDTKRYAILALESLGEACDFGSSSDQITASIEKVACIEPVVVVLEQ